MSDMPIEDLCNNLVRMGRNWQREVQDQTQEIYRLRKSMDDLNQMARDLALLMDVVAGANDWGKLPETDQARARRLTDKVLKFTGEPF